MSLLVVSSGIFFEFTRQTQWIWSASSMNLHLREYFIWLLYLSVVSAMQILLVCKSIYFARQINLLCSAIQFTFLSNSIYFAEQRNIHKHATRYIQAYYMAFQQHRENRSFETIGIRQCRKVWPWWSVRTSTPSATVGRVARNGIFPACHCLS